MNELTFDELRQIDGGSYEEGRELGHKIGKAFYGACAMYYEYLQPIITQYFIDNKSEIWLLFLIAHSKR